MADVETTNAGTNVTLAVDGDTLTITVDLSQEHGRSKSGKSVIIASTAGNVRVPGTDDVFLGLNVYKK